MRRGLARVSAHGRPSRAGTSSRRARSAPRRGCRTRRARTTEPGATARRTRGFRACRYDPCGTGKSEGRFEDATVSKYRDDLVAVSRALAGTEPLHLAGHSLGGTVSVLAASALAPRTVTTLGTNARKDSLRRL